MCIDCNSITETSPESTNQLQQDFKVETFKVFLPSIYQSDGVDVHSGVIQIDIDGMSQNEQQLLRLRLVNHPNVLMIFSSIRNGLRIFVLTTLADTKIDTKLHTLSYYQVLNHLEIANLQDNCGAKVKQPCLFSHDENCYYNENCIPFEIDHDKIQKEIKLSEGLSDITHEYDVDSDELLRAFKCINQNIGYDSRLEVNCAMFTFFGEQAKEYLQFHWNTDKTKLQKNLKEQFANNSGAYGIGTIFEYAYQNGYIANTHGTAVKRSNRSTQKISRTPLEQFHDVLNSKFELFFDKPKDTFLRITLGSGKTTTAMNNAIKHARSKKIDILVKSHNMAQQYIDDFKKINGDEWVEQHVIHIRGRNNDNCQKFSEIKSAGFKTGDYCKKCPSASNCKYVHQFDNNDNGVRIYTHNSLYNRSST